MRFRRDKSDQAVPSITAPDAKRPKVSWTIPCEMLQFHSFPPAGMPYEQVNVYGVIFR